MTRPKLYKDKTRIQVVCETSEKEDIQKHVRYHYNNNMSAFVLSAVRGRMRMDEILPPNPSQ